MNDHFIDSLARLNLVAITPLQHAHSSSRRRGLQVPLPVRTESESSGSSNDSGTPSTFSFGSDSDAIRSARSETLSFLSGSADSMTNSTLARKLAFYQSLLVLFGINVCPPSIKKCKAILRGVHVNLKEFLMYIYNGGSIAQVTRYPSRRALIKDLIASKSFANLKKAKKEMLNPLLAKINFK